MPKNKKKKPDAHDKSQTVEDNTENDVGFTKNIPASTQQGSNNFDLENFKESLFDFFDCKTSSIGKTYEPIIVNNNSIGKCSHCNKENVDLKKCVNCKAVSYCDRACQKADWSKHKAICRKDEKGPNTVPSETMDSSKEKKNEKVVDMKGDSIPTVKGVCSYCHSHDDDLKTCVRCKTAVYCDKQCQRAHWSEHKKSCGQQCEGKSNTTSADVDAKKKAVALSARADNNKNTSAEGGISPGGSHKKSCTFCKKERSTVIKCSKCQLVNYCDERCRVNHRLEHKVACDNLPKFVDAMSKASEAIADFHDCDSTKMILPPAPHPIFGSIGLEDGVALMVRIVEPIFHPFRHAVVVQDVNGEKAPMYFYHEESEEQALWPKKLNSMLAPGNFIRWFYPHWHFFLDGTLGFRINTLEEVEMLRSVTTFTFSPM